MRIDLHIHTTASDGTLPPEETVRQAVAGRLDVVAITDHDSAGGVEAAVEAAAATSLTVIAGTELSAAWEGRDVHILGFGVDPASRAIRDFAMRARNLRIDRMTSMVARLAELGVEVSMDEVVERAGGDRGMVGRPHLAAALVARGYAASVSNAFDTLIGNAHPAYVAVELATPPQALDTIRAAGGISVWAHPPRDLLETLLEPLVAEGLQGLEAYRPGWAPRRQRDVARAARARGLIVTGGSDWHGSERNGALGDFWVQPDQVPEFLDAQGLV